MSDTYIELGRTFRELTLGGDDDEVDYRHLGLGRGTSWQDLLAGHRTVILSEAGSGKTEEIRHAARTLRADGTSAFFLRLEHISDDFEIAFEEGKLAEFEQWLNSSEDGWLFLDSVDESRLREPKDFERAIRKIGVRISAALQRTHIVVTSRGTAWRPVTDLRLCEQHLKYVEPVPTDDDGNQIEPDDERRKSSFRIVALDDLSTAQIEIFAKARGVSPTKPFLDALERADAWAMAARPDDLNELVEFWNKNKRIGNGLAHLQRELDILGVERATASESEAIFLLPSEVFGLHEDKPFGECPIDDRFCGVRSIFNLAGYERGVIDLGAAIGSRFQSIGDDRVVGHFDTERRGEARVQLGSERGRETLDVNVFMPGGGDEHRVFCDNLGSVFLRNTQPFLGREDKRSVAAVAAHVAIFKLVEVRRRPHQHSTHIVCQASLGFHDSHSSKSVTTNQRLV